jgi:hypothetical protein
MKPTERIQLFEEAAQEVELLAGLWSNLPPSDSKLIAAFFARNLREHGLRKIPAPGDTGNPDADRIIDRLLSDDQNFTDRLNATVFIRRMIAEHRGPDEFPTWKDAAIAERVRRVKAMSDGEKNARAYLQELVTALDGAFVSSWQTTAAWQTQLDAARQYLHDNPIDDFQG